MQTNIETFGEEEPCMSTVDCPYAWACVNEGPGCPITGRHA